MLHDGGCPGIAPYEGVCQGFPGFRVPHHGCLTLIGDSDTCNGGEVVSLFDEFVQCARNAALNGFQDLLWIVL